MRRLATVRKISDIKKIENSDNLELAIVDGWQVVVEKGLHKPNDTIIYFEIDSILPIREEFEFLRSRCYIKKENIEGFRLRTIKLRGQISQGLILPISLLKQLPKILNEGDDVSECLGVVLYVPPVPTSLSGVALGSFPSFLIKTDEERIQNLSKYLDKYKGFKFYVTEKLDGTSYTAYYNNQSFGVCSRNLNLLESDSNIYWRLTKELGIQDKLRNLNRNIAIQGELIGLGVQKNKYMLPGNTIKFFSVFDIDSYKYLNYPEAIKLIKELALEFVPIVHNYFKLPNTIQEILDLADGESILNKKTKREGLVFRSLEDSHISFKAISNSWLLKNE